MHAPLAYKYVATAVMLSESYSGGALDGLGVTNGYDDLGDRTNLALVNGAGAVLASTVYGYGNYSYSRLLESISDGTNAAAYNYVAHQGLVDHIDYTQSGSAVMTTQKSWDNLKRLTAIQALTNGTALNSFQYAYNPAGQRIAVTNEHGGYWVYQYDALGQVISGSKHWSDGTLVAGQQFTYTFDTIGNRRTTGRGGDMMGVGLRDASYVPNPLNQYTSRMVPGVVDIVGMANSNATVTANNQRAFRQKDYFWTPLALSNGSSAVWMPVTNIAVLNNGSSPDIVATNIGIEFLPKTPEVYSYDLDGNLTQDGRWTYAWDAENRLTNMTSLSAAPTASKFKLDFTYDAKGRRMQKIVSTNNGVGYFAQYTNRFVYDGWNLTAILDGSSNLLYSFQWGLDLSGTMQGAGGVGGLNSMTVYSGANAGTYFYSYDGNGNVMGLLNASSLTAAAKYEYGPFGEVIRATGPMAFVNPFRFSTKYQDDESGFVYYGHRYYNSVIERWLNRDPLLEKGGLNLYGFCQNNSIELFDATGLKPVLVVDYDSCSEKIGEIVQAYYQITKEVQAAEDQNAVPQNVSIIVASVMANNSRINVHCGGWCSCCLWNSGGCTYGTSTIYICPAGFIGKPYPLGVVIFVEIAKADGYLSFFTGEYNLANWLKSLQ